jgi:hypothetical protein
MMDTTFVIMAPAPSADRDVTKPQSEIPSDWESKGVKSGVCVVAKEDADIPSDWESKGVKSGVCVIA